MIIIINIWLKVFLYYWIKKFIFRIFLNNTFCKISFVQKIITFLSLFFNLLTLSSPQRTSLFNSIHLTILKKRRQKIIYEFSLWTILSRSYFNLSRSNKFCIKQLFNLTGCIHSMRIIIQFLFLFTIAFLYPTNKTVNQKAQTQNKKRYSSPTGNNQSIKT